MPFFFDSCSKYAKRHWFYKYFGRPQGGHVVPPKGTSKIQKRAPRCMRTLRRKKKRTPRCMGMLFVLLWTPNQASPKSPKPIILNGLEGFFANTEKHHLKTWNGRPRDIEKQSARAPKMQHYTNGGAPSIGKRSTGAHTTPRHHDGGPPHAA